MCLGGYMTGHFLISRTSPRLLISPFVSLSFIHFSFLYFVQYLSSRYTTSKRVLKPIIWKWGSERL